MGPEKPASTSASVRDPVCGMTVDPRTSAGRHEHAGVVHHFCCEGCRAKFAADPEKYLAPGARPERMEASPGPLLSIGGSGRDAPLLTIGEGPGDGAVSPR